VNSKWCGGDFKQPITQLTDPLICTSIGLLTLMTKITKERILQELSQLQSPDNNGDIVSQGMISGIFIVNRKVFFSISVSTELSKASSLEDLRQIAQERVKKLEGVDHVVATLTSEKAPMEEQEKPVLVPPRPSQTEKIPVKNVDYIVVIASGKGGVGKSTTAVNLALGLSLNGLRVGLLDADIYGPSIPRLLALKGQPQTFDGRILEPMEKYGIKVMSMGLLVDEDAPMIWRGPMITSALTQMLRQVNWGKLDIIVIDMPPGTGDIHLSLVQKVPLAGAVIVSTPQDLALIDARKAIGMFQKMNVEILGIVENMSYFITPDTGKRYDIFGHGGAKAEAERINAPFLGEIPLDMSLRENSDQGTPLTATQPQGSHAKIYCDIAHKIWKSISSVD
jgi:ATP-binding protein involved in chromosome partitioning